MAPYQERVVQEKSELVEKTVKLRAFFETPTFAGLGFPERTLLRRQEHYMTQYASVLSERIAAFKE